MCRKLLITAFLAMMGLLVTSPKAGEAHQVWLAESSLESQALGSVYSSYWVMAGSGGVLADAGAGEIPELGPLLLGIGVLLAGLGIIGISWWKRKTLGPVLERGFEIVFKAPRPLDQAGPAPSRGLASLVGLGAVLALVGVYILMGQLIEDTGSSLWPRNPMPSTSQSRATGKEVYQQNCVECHGPEGVGDGPKARQFRADMDLSAHVLAHPSGQLFVWIGGGLGDNMPAFEGQLTEDQLWHLVNYIRTFGQFSLFGAHAH